MQSTKKDRQGPETVAKQSGKSSHKPRRRQQVPAGYARYICAPDAQGNRRSVLVPIAVRDMLAYADSIGGDHYDEYAALVATCDDDTAPVPVSRLFPGLAMDRGRVFGGTRDPIRTALVCPVPMSHFVPSFGATYHTTHAFRVGSDLLLILPGDPTAARIHAALLLYTVAMCAGYSVDVPGEGEDDEVINAGWNCYRQARLLGAQDVAANRDALAHFAAQLRQEGAEAKHFFEVPYRTTRFTGLAVTFRSKHAEADLPDDLPAFALRVWTEEDMPRYSLAVRVHRGERQFRDLRTLLHLAATVELCGEVKQTKNGLYRQSVASTADVAYYPEPDIMTTKGEND